MEKIYYLCIHKMKIFNVVKVFPSLLCVLECYYTNIPKKDRTPNVPLAILNIIAAIETLPAAKTQSAFVFSLGPKKREQTATNVLAITNIKKTKQSHTILFASFDIFNYCVLFCLLLSKKISINCCNKNTTFLYYIVLNKMNLNWSFHLTFSMYY